MNKVLVVVDWQNDFVNGVLGFEGAELMDDGITNKIISYGENGDIIIATRDTHDGNTYGDSVEGKILPIHTEKGKPGWEIFGGAKTAMNMYHVDYIDKPTFPSDELLIKLKQVDTDLRRKTGKGIERIEFVGVDAAICVISNIVMAIAALPNVPIRVHKNLIGSGDSEAKEAAIKVMKSMLVEVVE